MDRIVCSGYFLSSCLARKRRAISFAAIRFYAFLFLNHYSFNFPFHDHVHLRVGNSSLCAIKRATNRFVGVQCTFLTYTSSTTESTFWAILALHFYHCQVCRLRSICDSRYHLITLRQQLLHRRQRPVFVTPRCYAERGYATVYCLSVCPSIRPTVPLRYDFHTGWNSSKIMSLAE